MTTSASPADAACRIVRVTAMAWGLDPDAQRRTPLRAPVELQPGRRRSRAMLARPLAPVRRFSFLAFAV